MCGEYLGEGDVIYRYLHRDTVCTHSHRRKVTDDKGLISDTSDTGHD